MAYHPEKVEVSVSDVVISGRPNGKGGVEQIVSISPEVAARAVANMSYDSVYTFTRALGIEIGNQSESDKQRERYRCCLELSYASKFLGLATGAIRRTWDICQKHMTKVDGGYNGK